MAGWWPGARLKPKSFKHWLSSKAFSGFPSYCVPGWRNSLACSSTEHLPQEALVICTSMRTTGRRTTRVSNWSLVVQLDSDWRFRVSQSCGDGIPWSQNSWNSPSVFPENKNWSPAFWPNFSSVRFYILLRKPFYLETQIPYTHKLLCKVNGPALPRGRCTIAATGEALCLFLQAI